MKANYSIKQAKTTDFSGFFFVTNCTCNLCTPISDNDKTHVGKNREYFPDEKSFAHLARANRGHVTKGLRISFAIDGTVENISPLKHMMKNMARKYT